MSGIFVFGSNLAGRHGKGAALSAKMHYGAIYGKGEGLQGKSYAIPTKDGTDGKSLRPAYQTLPLHKIKGHVDKFIKFAIAHPEYTFMVCAIGTSHAGYTHDDIAPFFHNAPLNCVLPVKWSKIIPKENRKWWNS